MAAKGTNSVEIIKSIKEHNYSPVYLLHGEESYFIDEVSDFITENIVTADAKDFDLNIFYGIESRPPQVAMTACQIPMFGDYRVVVVREAQMMKDINLLSQYVEKCSPSTILVLCHKHKKLDGKTALYKAIEKKGTIMLSEKLRENNLPAFVKSVVKEKGLKITDKGIQILVSLNGQDLSNLKNEINKLEVAAGEGKSITDNMVMDTIGMNREFNTFELQRAILNKNATLANKIVLKIGGDKVAIQPVIPVLFNFFSNLLFYHKYLKNMTDGQAAEELGCAPYFIRDYRDAATKFDMWQTMKIISILRSFDAKSKGIGVSGTVSGKALLQEMVYMIIHCNGRTDGFEL